MLGALAPASLQMRLKSAASARALRLKDFLSSLVRAASYSCAEMEHLRDACAGW